MGAALAVVAVIEVRFLEASRFSRCFSLRWSAIACKTESSWSCEMRIERYNHRCKE